MPDDNRMLEAHVQFELDRLTGDGFRVTVVEEVAAAWDWLDTVPVEALLDREAVARFLNTWAASADADSPASETLTEGLHSLHEAARADQTTVADLIRKEDLDRMVEIVAGMSEVRRAIIHQVTSSEVYSGLIAHVLYQGIKGYVVSDGGLASRVPGASSLMKLGKGAISSAAPNLEKTVDRQLTSFVNANIQDSIRDSEAYLDSALDPELLAAVADEIWQDNASARIGQAADLVSAEEIDELSAAAWSAWLHLRRSETTRRVVDRGLDALLNRVGDWSIAYMLTSAGVTPDLLIESITELGEPVVSRAVEDGYLEARLRSRLAAFYDSYEG